ncbi:unnamed protein product [Blumeria hordei]|uniref:J domain-containing protein n=2 Tax=Blumeria hordei TaxID=2867405 RepID=A0A383UKV8_BLUHO|nr:DnaJ domain protein [Blumeria hordei DH14]SZF00205.1 unnamed protein product [Blumeria hordei]
MKILCFILCYFTSFISINASWSKEDQEVFRLRDEVEASEGAGVTFYDFLGAKPLANQDEINKAYRQRSRVLHPDKVKQQFITSQSSNKKPTKAEIKAAAQAASDRFARLGIVANILRGPGRERYDHFLNYGFPKWKGTGYYYARFRPGLGSVLVGLFIFVGGAGHWIVLYLSWKRRKEFISSYVTYARHAVFSETIPGLDKLPGATQAIPESAEVQLVNRRQRRMQEKDGKKEKKPKSSRIHKPAVTATADPCGPKKRVVAENGKILVVDSTGNVYLEQTDEEGENQEILLEPNELIRPTVFDTALCRLPIWAYSSISNRFTQLAPVKEVDDGKFSVDSPAVTSSDNDCDALEIVNPVPNGTTTKTIRRKKSRKVR